MAGVKAVEYINDSTTSGFAVAGDSVEITEQNAATIEKDDQNGNLETLDGAQTRYLEGFTENDKTDYDNTEGDENLDSVDAEQQEKDKQGNSAAAAGAATAGSMAALTFGAAILANTGNLQNIMNAFTAPVVGGVDVAVAAAGLAGVLTFDKDYGKRLSEANAAAEKINAVNQYYETLNKDLEALNGTDDNTSYEVVPEEGAAEGEGQEGETQDIISILSQLYTQLDKANADKDQARASEISAKISQIETTILANIEGAENTGTETTGETATAEGVVAEGGTEGATEAPASPEEATGGGLLDHFATNNTGAHEAFDTATNVASFLREGNNIGSIGIMNTAALAGCAAISGVLAARAFTGVTIFTIAQATVGAALCGTAAGIFAGASVTMGVKAANELKAGSKGSDVYSAANNLRQPMNEHDSIVEKLQGAQEKAEESTSPTTAAAETPGAAEATAIAGSVTSGSSSTSGGASSSGGSSSGGGTSTSGSATA